MCLFSKGFCAFHELRIPLQSFEIDYMEENCSLHLRGKYEWKLPILLLLLFSTYDVRTNSMKIEDPNNEMNAFNFDA